MRALFVLFFLSFGLIHSNSQEVNIGSIPYSLKFENEPQNFYIVGANHIQITAGEKTDLFISPDGKFVTNKSPRLLFKPDTDFILTTKISLEFKSNWDAGVLLVYNDSLHYAKFCFEKDYTGQKRIVSVVCNERGDDCNSLAIAANEVFYRIIGSPNDDVFSFYYSSDNKSWYLIRSFRLLKTDNIRVGFSSQSPAGKSCIVDFSDIELQKRKPIDFWKGN